MTAYYIDTNIFLNVIYKEQEFFEMSKKFLQRIHSGESQALTSSITLLEITLDMAESGYTTLADKAIASIEDMHSLDIIPLDKTMTKQAATLVLKDNLTIHDAYHLATALCQKAEAFITRDVELQRKINRHIKPASPETV